MADLEEMGFVASPHTSAGRIPTPKGYRLLTLLDFKRVFAYPRAFLAGVVAQKSTRLAAMTASPVIVSRPTAREPLQPAQRFSMPRSFDRSRFSVSLALRNSRLRPLPGH